MNQRFRARLALALCAFSSLAHADEVQVAVAANFAGPAKLVAERFALASGHKASISVGSTGKFYAQIANGAPFEVMLSADDETPLRLEKEKLAVAGTRFTYAIGKIVLWSADPALVDGHGEVLRRGAFKRLAIANPKLAPYGTAAQQVLERLGRWQPLQGRLVLGENIAQTLQFVASGNAQLGFVALSQIQDGGKPPAGSRWLVPQSLYDPIRQDATLLVRGERNPAARAWLAFLRSAEAKDLVRAAGYELPG